MNKIVGYDMYSINQKIVVDKVYKFEDFKFFEEDITRRFKLKDPFKLTSYKAKSSSRLVRDYTQLLDDKSRKLIEKHFEREIDLLGYTF